MRRPFQTDAAVPTEPASTDNLAVSDTAQPDAQPRARIDGIALDAQGVVMPVTLCALAL